LAVTAAVAAVFIAGAGAVYNTGIFQLDGNASLTVPYGPGGAEDWINICAKWAHAFDGVNHIGADICNPASATALNGITATKADRSTFITDAFNSGTDDIFKGGTDDGSINNPPDGVSGTAWTWKSATPSPNKADIEQAFAAQYTCGVNYTCPAGYGSDRIVYFGGTRYANVGDTNIGVWFLHNKVTECGTGASCPVDSSGNPTAPPSCSPASGCGFTGSHTCGNVSLGHATTCNGVAVPAGTPGDIFVQSAFTSTPSINVFEWVGPGNATAPCVTNACDLQPVPLLAGTTQKCPSSDLGGTLAACALVNDFATICTKSTSNGTNCTGSKADGSVTSPWLFTDAAAHSPANTFGDSELFEGGIDLTKLGFGGACTSSFLLNTRSSGSSVNSTAQDFALGQLGKCGSSMTTLAASNASGLTLDNSTTSANGTVSSGTDTAKVTVTGGVSWSGTVDFYLCGPIPSNATSQVCDNGGVKLNGTTNNVGVPISSGSDPTQPVSVSSGTGTLTSAGRYCWFSHFHATTPASGVPDADENGSTTTNPNTNPSDPNPECFTVGPVNPTLSTTAVDASGNALTTAVNIGTTLYDQATLSGTAKEPSASGTNTTWKSILASTPSDGKAAQGTITFWLYGPAANQTPTTTECNTLATDANGVSFPSAGISVNVNGNNTYPTTNPSSAKFTPGAAGYYFWKAQYSGDPVNTTGAPLKSDGTLGVHNADCSVSAEEVHILQLHTTTQTTPVDGTGAAITTVINGTKVYDQAIVSDSTAGGGPPTGTVDFYVCDPTQIANANTPGSENCAGTGSVGGSGGGTGTLVQSGVSLTAGPSTGPPALTSDQSLAISTTAVTLNQVGVWCFRADYNPDSTKFIGSSDNTHDECFKVVDVTMKTAQTFTVKDTATITPSGPGASIGGKVSFQLYPNADCNKTENDTPLVDDSGLNSKTVAANTVAENVDSSTATITTTATTLSWLVIYTPSSTATNKTVTSTCATENSSLTINNGS
jgi:hypothetical protein